MSGFGYDTGAYEPSQGFEPLPYDDYLVLIAGAELKPTKDNQGQFVEVKFQVVDGKYKNRLVWSRINIHNRSEAAQKIGREELAAILEAIGRKGAQNVEHILGGMLVIKVATKNDPQQGPINVIRSYKPNNNQVAPRGYEKPVQEPSYQNQAAQNQNDLYSPQGGNESAPWQQ